MTSMASYADARAFEYGNRYALALARESMRGPIACADMSRTVRALLSWDFAGAELSREVFERYHAAASASYGADSLAADMALAALEDAVSREVLDPAALPEAIPMRHPRREFPDVDARVRGAAARVLQRAWRRHVRRVFGKRAGGRVAGGRPPKLLRRGRAA